MIIIKINSFTPNPMLSSRMLLQLSDSSTASLWPGTHMHTYTRTHACTYTHTRTHAHTHPMCLRSRLSLLEGSWTLSVLMRPSLPPVLSSYFWILGSRGLQLELSWESLFSLCFSLPLYLFCLPPSSFKDSYDYSEATQIITFLKVTWLTSLIPCVNLILPLPFEVTCS